MSDRYVNSEGREDGPFDLPAVVLISAPSNLLKFMFGGLGLMSGSLYKTCQSSPAARGHIPRYARLFR